MYTYYHYYMSQKIESIFICLSFFGHISSQTGLTWRELVYIVRLALEFFFSIIIINDKSVKDLFV